MNAKDALIEDIGEGDITSNCLIEDNIKAKAIIVSNSRCVLSGMEEAKRVFESLNLTFIPFYRDGEVVEGKIAEVIGKAKDILVCERVALNFLSRMSGIATYTRKLVEMARQVNSNVEVLATRKTTPFFRKYEKKAVVHGGGKRHRDTLSSHILIKDNHLKIIGSVKEAVLKAKRCYSGIVEIEVESLSDALDAIEAGADVIMLDNMSAKTVKEIVSEIERRKLRKDVCIEVSGGINEENIKDFAESGVDRISVGVITHSPRASDFSLDIVEVVD